MSTYDQAGADVRFDWGRQGLEALLAGGARTIVIVDVLRFTTAVDVACGRGAAVTPWPLDDEAAAANTAARFGAQLVQPSLLGGDISRPSLSPVSLRNLLSTDHIVLPSPNGATLACLAAAAGVTVYAGCLRNAAVVAEAIVDFPVGVIAAGERWPDRSLRPAIEDAWGAGAVIAALGGPAASDSGLALFALFGDPQPDQTSKPPQTVSPEAAWVAAGVPIDLATLLPQTASGRELLAAGWALDVEVAAARDVSRTVPKLDKQGTFRAS